MAEIRLSNRLGTALMRSQFDKHSLIEPPAEVPPNTTLAWQVEGAGWVTYDVPPDAGAQGTVKRFTLAWTLSPAGEVSCRTRDAASKLKVEIEQSGQGVLCIVSNKRRRLPPPPARRWLVRALAPLTAGLLIVSLLGGITLAHGNVWSLLSRGRAQSSITSHSTVSVSPGATVTAAPHLVTSPDQTTTVTCSGSQVSYPPVTLLNTGGSALTWQASASAGAAVSPASGSVAAGASQRLSVSQRGPTQKATSVSITSNGGNSTVRFTCASTASSSHGKLVSGQTMLPLVNYCGDSVNSSSGFTVTLYNIGNGFLTWSQASASAFSLSPSSGQLGAGASAQVAVSGTKANATIQINWQDGGKGTVNTVSVQTTCNQPPAPHANLVVSANQNYSETCNGSPAAPYTVTLSNAASNVTVGWTWTPASTWATASPASGTVSAGQSASFNVSPTICPSPTQATQAHASLNLSFPQGGSQPSISLTDTITGPAPHANLQAQYSQADSCTSTPDGPFPGDVAITLVNNGNVPVTWTFTSANADSHGVIWASASPSSGTVNPNQSVPVTLNVDQTVCGDASNPFVGTGILALTFPQGGSEPNISISVAISHL